MNSKEFFKAILDFGVSPYQALQLEQLVVQVEMHNYLREGEPREREAALDERLSARRMKLLQEIVREVKEKGGTVESVLAILT